MTEIDFITRTTSTTKVSEEGGPIVQLSYFKQLLLISSTLRSCLCFTNLASKKVEVGSQPRYNNIFQTKLQFLQGKTHL